MIAHESATLHRPVLLDEALAALAPHPDGIYVDATYGRGGHARGIVERLGPQGRLIVIDRDPQAVAVAYESLGGDPRVAIEQGSFAQLDALAARHEVEGRVDGVLFDLGVSSPQLDDPDRGFSFQHEGPLDMRLDPQTGPSAAQWLERADEREIADVIFQYGEERYARRIARAIVAARSDHPVRTTSDLVRLIEAAVPRRERHKHPATRTFQAIRIHVNGELEALREALPRAVDILAPGGRLVVISFHSLEDRIVKRFIRDEARGGGPQPPAPPAPGRAPRLRALGRPRVPARTEREANPRARSARLRAAERLA